MPSSEVPLRRPMARRGAVWPARSCGEGLFIVGPVCRTQAIVLHDPPRRKAKIMATLRSPFIEAMQSRGFMHQCTDLEALDAAASAGPIVAYVGYDCTADSLHVGNLVSVMMLRWLQKTGPKPIALMAG